MASEVAMYLQLDTQTIKDLELFQSEAGGDSLYDFCNQTHTSGGAKELKQRMAQPWANAEDIIATQAALQSIQAHRGEFEPLLNMAYTAGRVDQYLSDVLPLILQENTLEFAVGAVGLWSNSNSHFSTIFLGVKFAVRLLHALNSFSKSSVVQQAQGELKPLLDEMCELLSKPRLKQLPEEDDLKWMWSVLRLDQSFRLHEKATLDRLREILYEIDALVSLADTSQRYGFEFPEAVAGDIAIEAQGLWHPFVEDAVVNPFLLDQSRRVLFLTGPNMAGKTTYMRAFATALYFAQLGMAVPASQFKFTPVEHLFSSISLSDDLRNGVSYFKAEALRVKAVAEALAKGAKIVALMDEPFKGTNIKDAYDASLEILSRFSKCDGCLFVFSSHLIELSDVLNADGQTIDCKYFDAREGEGRLAFDYKIRSGVSAQRLGMRVLEEEGIFGLLDKV